MPRISGKYNDLAVLAREVKEEIVEGAARAFYVTWWAQREEEKKGFQGWHGAELMDVAPRTPKTVVAFAKKFIRDFEKVNNESASSMYHAAINIPGKRYSRREPTPELFGHYTAMQAMGHGVGWSDDYPDHGFKIPRAEYYGPGSRY